MRHSAIFVPLLAVAAQLLLLPSGTSAFAPIRDGLMPMRNPASNAAILSNPVGTCLCQSKYEDSGKADESGDTDDLQERMLRDLLEAEDAPKDKNAEATRGVKVGTREDFRAAFGEALQCYLETRIRKRAELPFNCSGVTLTSRSDEGIKQYAKEMSVLSSNLTVTEVEQRAMRAVCFPYKAVKSDVDIADLPMVVWEASICYYITNDIDAVRSVCKSNKVKLNVRKTSNETLNEGKTSGDKLGYFCIIEYGRKEDGQPAEYYLVPVTKENQAPYLSVAKVNRTEIPFDWNALASVFVVQSMCFVLATLLSVLLRIPNYGFGKSFAMNRAVLLSNICSLKTAIGCFFANSIQRLRSVQDPSTLLPIFISGTVLALLMATVTFENIKEFFEDDDEEEEEDFDWIDKLPRHSLSTLRESMVSLGTRRRPLRALFASFIRGAAPGIAEELMFRGVIQTALTRWFGLSFAVPFQAALFGLLHAGWRSKRYMFLTCVYGYLAGLIYSYTGNLALPILLHAGNNMFATLVFHYAATSLTWYELGRVIAVAPQKLFPKEKEGVASKEE